MEQINNIINSKDSFFLLAGPCVIESAEVVDEIACKMVDICNRLSIPYVFKASYRKANRSSISSFTGIGDKEGLEILSQVSKKYSVPVVTDIHSAEEAEIAAKYVDILQIPAFLCRQTDILEAAAKTGKWINIKKGQFLSPESMRFAAEKVAAFGNSNIILTDRGTMFGYQDLVVDFRSIPKMKHFGHPVVMDITHSLQQPNQSKGVTGGEPDMIETIARAAIAVGADGIFMEVHPRPWEAKSDGANMLKLDLAEDLLRKLKEIHNTIKKL